MLFDCDELYVTPLWMYTRYVCNNLDCILKTDSAMDEIATLIKKKQKRLANNLENYTIRRSTNNSVCADGQAKNRFKRLHNYTISNKMRRPAKCYGPTHTANVVQKKNRKTWLQIHQIQTCCVSLCLSIYIYYLFYLTDSNFVFFSPKCLYFDTTNIFPHENYFKVNRNMCCEHKCLLRLLRDEPPSVFFPQSIQIKQHTKITWSVG